MSYTPSMTTTPPRKGHPWRTFFLFAAAVASGAFLYNTMNRPADTTPVVSMVTVQQACEGAVGQNLKAPATAQYNSQASGSGPWRVVGTVDSENSFGALVRAQYQCSVTVDGDRVVATLEMLE